LVQDGLSEEEGQVTGSRERRLMVLGEGVYTVAEVARILRPTMTSRKVHYWLKKGILGDPVRPGSPGRPALLSFEQLLMARTVQHLRDNLQFSLQRIAPSIEILSSFVFGRLFDEEWYMLRFFETDRGTIGVTDGLNHSIEVDTGQFVMPEVLPELEAFLNKTRQYWERHEVDIEGFPHLVSNAGIVGGSPTIRETRIETAFVAYLAQDLSTEGLRNLYPYVEKEALLEAVRFESWGREKFAA
jgi:uncharacterized protein (DUF433 family)/DNA-binding transcriptional MerR regulator